MRAVSFCILLIWGWSHFCYGEITEETADPTCKIDATKLEFAIDNYMDCNTEENIAQKRTQCCNVGDSVGCCEDSSVEEGRMLKIAMGIIGVTIGLSILLCICLWVDTRTCPCIGRCLRRCDPCCERCQENCICCRGRVERRKYERQIVEHQRQVEERQKNQVRGDLNGGYDQMNDMRTAGDIKLPMPTDVKQPTSYEWF